MKRISKNKIRQTYENLICSNNACCHVVAGVMSMMPNVITSQSNDKARRARSEVNIDLRRREIKISEWYFVIFWSMKLSMSMPSN